MKKLIIYFIILFILALCSLLTFNKIRNSSVELITPLEQISSNTIIPAEKINFQLNLAIPWGNGIKSADLTLHDDFTTYGDIEISYNIWSFGYSRCKIEFTILPLNEGEFSDIGTLILSYNSPKNIGENLKIFPINDINVEPNSDNYSDDLLIAGTLTEVKAHKKYYWIFATILALVIALIIYLLLRNRAKISVIEIPPWDLAQQELDRLKNDGSLGKTPLNICFGLVNDVLRNYIEKRFKLPATSSTTPEFLEDLRKNSGELNPKLSEGLSDFMLVSDVVKFGKGEVDRVTFDNSITRAKNLILETTPKEEKNV